MRYRNKENLDDKAVYSCTTMINTFILRASSQLQYAFGKLTLRKF